MALPLWIHQIAETWLAWVLAMSWQAALLVAVVWVLCVAARRASPRLRHALWCLVLVKLCLPPSLTLVTGIGSWFPARTERASLTAISSTTGADASETPRAEGLAAPIVRYGRSVARGSGVLGESAAVPPTIVWLSAWLLGGLVVAGLVVRACQRMRRRLRTSATARPDVDAALRRAQRLVGTRRTVELLVARDLASPVLWGLWRPRIVLPASVVEGLPLSELEPIFVHELVHLRRGDLWLNLLQTVLQVVYWFHPLVWVANVRLRRERELIVDDVVLTHLRGRHGDYGRSLVNVVEQSARPAWLSPGYVGIVETSRSLAHRLRRIADTKRRLPVRLGIASIMLIAGVALFLIPQATPAERAPRRPQDGAQSPAAGVSGKVVGPDGQPAAGATVYHYRLDYGDPTRSGVRGRTTADSDGAFRFDGVSLDDGRTSIVAIAESCGVASWSFGQMPKDMPSLRLHLPREAVLTGVVVSPDGSPAANAHVQVTELFFRTKPKGMPNFARFDAGAHFGPLAGETNGDGRFAIRHLPKDAVGSCVVYVRHGDSAAAAMRISLQDVAKELRVGLRRGGAISGRVTHEDTDAPADGRWLRIHGGSGAVSVFLRAKCDHTGFYSLDHLPEGEYYVSAGRARADEWVAHPRNEIKVVSGETIRGVDLVLRRGCLITGEVVDADTGKPVGNAAVYTQSCEVPTEPDGTFRIRCLPGTHTVRILTAPAGYAPPAWPAGEEVTAEKGDAPVHVRLEIAKGLTLAGTIVDPQGRRVPGASVGYHVDIGRPASALTDGKGCYLLQGVLPNSVVAIIVRDPRTNLGLAFERKVKSRSVKGMTIRLLPMATVTGRVVDEGGRPVRGLSVMLRTRVGRHSTGNRSAYTDDQGRYSLSVAPGVQFDVTASTMARGRGHRVVAEPRRRYVRNITTRAHVRTTVSGRVLGPTGEPMSRARVTLRAGWYRYVTGTDAQGEFHFKSVMAKGAEEIRIAAQGPEGRLTGQTVLALDEASQGVEVRLAGTGSLTGRVLSDDGEPIDGATVVVHAKAGMPHFTSVGSTTTDVHGRYVMDKLMPETHAYVSAKATGYVGKRSKNALIVSAKRVEIEDLMLLRGNSFVAGRVTDADGKPLAQVRVFCPLPGGTQRSTRTDNKGDYRIEGIPKVAGLSVRAEHAGYYDDCRRDVAGGSTDVNLALALRDDGYVEGEKRVQDAATPSDVPPQRVAMQLVDALRDGNLADAERLFISREEFRSVLDGPNLDDLYDRLAKRFRGSLERIRLQMSGAKYVRMDTRFRLKPSPQEAGRRLGPLRLTRRTLALDNVRAIVLINGVERRLKLDELIKIGDSWRLLDAPRLMP